MKFTVGQHRDLKINYDYLCEINSIVKKYIDALEELQSETEAFVEIINNQEGDVFVELKNEYEDAIVVDYTDLIDILKEIYHVSGRYIEEMQYYISPENSSMLCRVDRNDIWWNLQQIKAIPYAYVEAYPHVPSHYYMDEFVNPFADDADEVRARNEDRRRRRENNYNKLVDFYNNTIRSTADGLWQDTEDLKSIYDNYVVEYENTDDVYARKMDELYDSIKNWIDIAGDLWEGTTDFLRGFGTGIVDLAKGLKAPLEIMLAINPSTPLPLGVKIALLYDGGNEIYQGVKVFINDPENTIGAMFQGMFDTGDEEGTAFCVGYATEKVVEVIVAKKVAEAMAGPKVAELDAVPSSEIHNPVIDSPRIGSALKIDDIKPITQVNPITGKVEIIREFPGVPRAHGFTDLVDNYVGIATETSLGNATLYQVEGSLNGVPGRFEWIIQDGYVTHRMFIQNGIVNGVPIKP